MNNRSTFLKYVIPSIIVFALSGIYAIVDGYFVGNTIGDAGLSAINIAYPIVALIQAIATYACISYIICILFQTILSFS